jgi:protein kinase A
MEPALSNALCGSGGGDNAFKAGTGRFRGVDVIKHQLLGSGAFGEVWLVSHRNNATPFALKQLNKRKVIDKSKHQGHAAAREKDVMASLDHPFVIKLLSTFQDDNNLYMVMDFVQGGDLFSVIHTETYDGIPDVEARFYAACILEALDYLHENFILHRDVKPENILIDRSGYCVLADFGFAKRIADNEKTRSFCGSAEYLAPEIILHMGHNKGVDYWSLGVVIYEMLLGRTPFYSPGLDQKSLYYRIVHGKYAFPQGGRVHQDAQDLIQRLLFPSQRSRLGSLSRGAADVRDHKWFSCINRELLLQKKIPAPWKPYVTDSLDARHFPDAYHRGESEPSSTQPPLSAFEQAQFENF